MLKLSPIECTLCENDFGRYCVPYSSRHRPAAQEVLAGKVWERDTVEFMRRNVGGDDIIHAGMYYGDFLPGLSSALAAGRKIFGFEPNPENFAAAQWTVALNSLANVEIANHGLGDTGKTGRMRMFDDGIAKGGGSYIIPDGHDGPERGGDVGAISIVSVDAVLPSTARVSIIQLDVEGYEGLVLAGAKDTIRAHRPIIIVETVPIDFISTYLIPLNYKADGEVCGNSIFVP